MTQHSTGSVTATQQVQHKHIYVALQYVLKDRAALYGEDKAYLRVHLQAPQSEAVI